MKAFSKLFFLIILVNFLQGCIGMAVVGGGGYIAGKMAVGDRRTLGTKTKDISTSLEVKRRASSIAGEFGRISVTTFNGLVLLTGEIRDDLLKNEVEKQILTIKGVRSLENDLEVAPLSDFNARTRNTIISGKVKAALLDVKDIYVGSFKVHTDRGTVYLMGRVTQREGRLAAEAARNISANIKKVVKLFDYITEDDLSDMVNVTEEQDEKK
tara:strand:+ start:808 stop:1443 length:636 start_codon:yes stop_codon:yes gene_type:complete